MMSPTKYPRGGVLVDVIFSPEKRLRSDNIAFEGEDCDSFKDDLCCPEDFEVFSSDDEACLFRW